MGQHCMEGSTTIWGLWKPMETWKKANESKELAYCLWFNDILHWRSLKFWQFHFILSLIYFSKDSRKVVLMWTFYKTTKQKTWLSACLKRSYLCGKLICKLRMCAYGSLQFDILGSKIQVQFRWKDIPFTEVILCTSYLVPFSLLTHS